jgi:hypothetical protein
MVFLTIPTYIQFFGKQLEEMGQFQDFLYSFNAQNDFF